MKTREIQEPSEFLFSFFPLLRLQKATKIKFGCGMTLKKNKKEFTRGKAHLKKYFSGIFVWVKDSYFEPFFSILLP